MIKKLWIDFFYFYPIFTSMKKNINLPFFLASCLMFLSSGAFGDQNDERLDELFKQLAKPAHPSPTYQMLEKEIWTIWGQTSESKVQNLMDLGQQSMQLGMFTKALAQYTRATELAPDFAEGWNKQATVLYLLDRYPDSLVAVNKTLSLEPRHFGALSGLGLIYEIYGEERGAKAAYEMALSYNPYMVRVKKRVKHLKSISDDADI